MMYTKALNIAYRRSLYALSPLSDQQLKHLFTNLYNCTFIQGTHYAIIVFDLITFFYEILDSDPLLV